MIEITRKQIGGLSCRSTEKNEDEVLLKGGAKLDSVTCIVRRTAF
jgi:hypothetical protein